MFAEGVLLLERVLTSHDHGKLDSRSRPSSRTRSRRSATPPARPGPPRRGGVRGPGAGVRRPPAARPAQRRGALPLLRRPGTRAVLQLVRVLPALRGRLRRREDRQGRQRDVPHRRRAAARRRGHGLRRDLHAADPPDRRGQPQGRQQHAHPDARRRRLALGDRQQGRRARRDPPRPRHVRRLRRVRGARPRELGLEVALDFALQAAPDHPWATEHPEWFTTRADGTIAYAENPPKKYQDIYPINFDNDPDGIYAETERLLRHWMSHGVRIFRVDNPHTKPVVFWEWLLDRIRTTDPDVLFLSEAFTTPPMMRALAHGRASTRATPTSPGATPAARSRPTCTRSRTSPPRCSGRTSS